MRFRVFRGEPFGGSIAAYAVRGENLHVFYRDGSHYRLRFVERLMSEPPGDEDAPEITAPGDVVPKAVYGDVEDDSVYALVSTDSAIKLPLHVQPKRAVTSDASTNGAGDDDKQPPPVTGESLIDESGSHSKTSLVRYHRGEWQFVAICPEAVDTAKEVWLATIRGDVAILYSNTSNNLMLALGNTTGWQALSAGPKLNPDGVLSFFTDQNVFTLLANESTEAATTPDVKTYRWLDGVWKPGERLEIKADPSLKVGDEVAAGMFGKGVVLAYELKSEGASSIWAGVWPMSGGSPLMEPTEVLPLNQNFQSSTSTDMASIAIAIILSVLLFIVFVRRTPSLFVEMEVPKGYMLAGAGKRTLAFVIDLFALSLIAFPLFITPWMTANLTPGEDIQQEFNYLLEFDRNVAFGPWIKCLLLFVVYATVMELFCRATIGKLVLGLRVCSTSGGRGSSLAIIVRNCLRFELYYKLSFLPLAMLVILTRNHQRLGDLVANTMVIEAIKQAPNQPTQT